MSSLTANQELFVNALSAANAQMARSTDFMQQFASADTKHASCFDSYGWPSVLTFAEYWSMYKRSGYGGAIINKLIDKCWVSDPWVMQSEQRKTEQRNQWESEFYNFARKHDLWFKLQELDRMQAVGQYAGLLLEVRDGKRLDEPMLNVKMPMVSNLLVATEAMLQPQLYDDDTQSARYGLPKTYILDRSEFGDHNPHTVSKTTVHHSRVMIWAEGAVNDGVFGESKLERPFNALLSLQKLTGAGPEGFWQASRGSLKMTFDKDADLNKLANLYGVSLSELPDELGRIVEDFRRNYDNVIAMQGGVMEPITFSLPSPKDYEATLLNEIAAASGVPLTEMIGQQVDARSSEENGKQFISSCENRRNGFLDRSIRKTINWFMSVGILQSSEFEIFWQPLHEPSLTDRLELADKMASVNLKRAQTVSALMSVGMDDGQPDAIFTTNEIRDATGFEALETVGIDLAGEQ
jgi:uncharacterized protein